MDKIDYLDALTAYSKNASQEIPPVLEQYLNGVAKNGETLFHWSLMKPLIFGKLDQVIEDMRKGLSSETILDRPNMENIPFDVMHGRILEALHKFNGAPFTMQRLCELLIDPKRHYKRSDKFLRGLEKNVLVVSTVDPFGRKVVSEVGGRHLANGLDTSGSPFFPRDSSISSNLPPVPGWVTTTVSVTSTPLSSTADPPEQKQTQPPSQDCSNVTADDVDDDHASSVNPDREPSLAVHQEDSAEKTEVAMDTSEAGSSTTDVCETEAGEEPEGADDTNASSSSSSSDELSASGTGESSDVATTVVHANESHTSPWALVAGEREDKAYSSSTDSDPNDSDTADFSDTSDKPSESSPSRSLPDKHTDSSLLSTDEELNSTQPERAERIEQPDTCTELSSTDSPLDMLSGQQNSLDESTGFDTTFTSEATENMRQTANDHSQHWPESDDSCNGGPGSKKSDELTPASPAKDDTVSNTIQSNQPLGSCTEVVTTSAVDTLSMNNPLLNCTNEHDNISGPTLGDSDKSLPSSPLHSPTKICRSKPHLSRLSSLADSSFDSDEPQTKRRKLSDGSSVTMPISSNISNTVSTTTSETESSSCYTPEKSIIMADTSTDNISPKSDTMADTSTGHISPKSDTMADTSTGHISPKSDTMADTSTGHISPKSDTMADTSTGHISPKSDGMADTSTCCTIQKSGILTDSSSDCTTPKSDTFVNTSADYISIKSDTLADTSTGHISQKSDTLADTSTGHISIKSDTLADTSTGHISPKSDIVADTSSDWTSKKSSILTDSFSDCTTPKSDTFVDTSAGYISLNADIVVDTSTDCTSQKSDILADSSSCCTTPTGYTSPKSNIVADTFSESNSNNSATSSSWDQRLEAQESMDFVSGSGKDSELASPDVAQEADDPTQRSVASPLSQLSSTSNSQGFDGTSDTLDRTSAEVRQMDELVQDDQSQEMVEDESVTSPSEDMPEAMVDEVPFPQ